MLTKHPFGQSPLSTTRLGLGMAALGRPGYINLGHADDLNRNYAVEAMEQKAHHVLQYAWEQGIRYFDTARSYGKGELFLGNWLRRTSLSHDALMIGSKWGYTYTADWAIEAEKHEVKEHSLTVLNRQWQETQATLGEYLDLYQIHSATLESGVLTNTDVLNRLAALKSQGTLIGLSLSGSNQGEVLRAAMAIKIDGLTLFDSVQATYNLLEPSAGEILQEAHYAGMGVIIKEALANGRLSSRNQDPILAPLREEAAAQNVGIDALALAAVLSQPWADVVLSGAATIEHLSSNLQAIDIAWHDVFDERFQSLREAPEKYWQTRKELHWN
ncbi:MAG: aldo/keto reductase [Bacteroidota bacterium]